MTFFNFLQIRFKRNKMYVVINFLILLIIGVVISGSLSSIIASDNTSRNIKQKIPPIVTLDPCIVDLRFRTMNYEQGINFINLLNKTGNLPYVERMEHSILLQLQPLYLRFHEPEHLRGDLFSRSRFVPPPGEGFDFVSIQGFSKPDIVYIISGEQEIVAGRTFSESEINPISKSNHSVAIISHTLAIYNNLWVGDTFTMSATTEWNQKEDRVDFYFEIIGIRDYNTIPVLEEPYIINYTNNLIFVPNWFAQRAINQLSNYSTWWGESNWLFRPAHFVLHDINDIPNFIAEAENIFPYGMTFIDYSWRFSPIINASATARDIFVTFTVCVVFASLLVIVLLSTWTVNSRRHELGIYIALGAKKKKILTKVIIEQIIIAISSLTFSLIIGNIVASQISTRMIHEEFTNINETRHWLETIPTTLEMAFGFQELTPMELMAAFDVSLNFSTIVAFYGLMLVIVTISALFTTNLIIKLNPKKILL